MAVCGIYRMHPIVLRQAFKFSKIAQCERKKSIPKTKDRWHGTICLEVKAYIYAYILYIDIFYHIVFHSFWCQVHRTKLGSWLGSMAVAKLGCMAIKVQSVFFYVSNFHVFISTLYIYIHLKTYI